MEELVYLFIVSVLITAIFAGLLIWLLFKIAGWAKKEYERKRKTKVISDLRWLLLGEEEGK